MDSTTKLAGDLEMKNKDQTFDKLLDLIDETLCTIEKDSEDVATYFAGVAVFVSRLTNEACERMKEKDKLK